MAREKLFPIPKDDEGAEDDRRTPKERFDALAAQVFRVTKERIDKREEAWKRNK